MAIPEIRNRYGSLLASIGKAAVHSLHPDDFEYYACSFELVDYEGNLVDMLFFPVTPSTISITKPNIANVRKSSSAVISLFNPSFVPFTISLNGNFGRKFRFLVGQEDILASAFRFNFRKESEFNVAIKTGYGVTKVLERLLENANSVDDAGRPFRLFFHNQAFNSSHLVEVLQQGFTINERKNFIWDYNITSKALAPALSVRSGDEQKSSLTRLLAFDNVQKGLNLVAGTALEEYQKSKNKLFN
jgi:hypothetical protein